MNENDFDLPGLWDFDAVPNEPEGQDPEVEKGHIRLPPVSVTPSLSEGLEQSWILDKARGYHRLVQTLPEYREGKLPTSPFRPVRHRLLRNLVGRIMLKLSSLRKLAIKHTDPSTKRFLKESILFLQKKLGKLHDRIR